MSIKKQEIIDAYWFRHACKEFDATQKISDEDFGFILETGRLSPSSFGIEPWKFLVVQNMELREKLRVHTWGGQKQLPTASHVIVCLFRKSCFMRYDSDYVQNFMRQVQGFPEPAVLARTAIIEKFQRYDYALLDSEQGMSEWSIRQTYLPFANMMTSAAMIGIDSCPIEGFEKTALEQVLVNDFGVDLESWGLAYLLAFGYRKGIPAREKTRQNMESVVEWFI
ncbi:NAD(P)H-dependent oxidoreductase [Methylomonas sp. AM2-LC]|uniref:NAD(P)H-dependent oxidoreductase n=1 Tax=Methylomonas sp. AM2-LC TaxID=3153301 RepID=UPI003265E5DB